MPPRLTGTVASTVPLSRNSTWPLGSFGWEIVAEVVSVRGRIHRIGERHRRTGSD